MSRKVGILYSQPQKDSVARPAKYAAMIIYEPKPKMNSYFIKKKDY
jgi:hypothetical protein